MCVWVWASAGAFGVASSFFGWLLRWFHLLDTSLLGIPCVRHFVFGKGLFGMSVDSDFAWPAVSVSLLRRGNWQGRAALGGLRVCLVYMDGG